MENNPVNGNDPDGLLSVYVHGTVFGNQRPTYADPGTPFNDALKATYGEDIYVFRWTGGNSVSARTAAATKLLNEVQAMLAPGEQFNFVGHSHGGNVGKEFTQLPGAPFVDTFVALGTPQRVDYTINSGNVGQYINAFTRSDQVQRIGGPVWLGGLATRQDDAATNVNVGSQGWLSPLGSHFNMRSTEVWNNNIDQLVTPAFPGTSPNFDLMNSVYCKGC